MEYKDLKQVLDNLLMDIAGTARTVPLEEQFKIILFLDEYLDQKDRQRKQWEKMEI